MCDILTKELPGGVIVAIRPPLHHNKAWLKGGYYEGKMLSYIRENNHGGTFVDCGACVGNHTLFFAKFCAEQVIAIEPVQSNMDYLVENVRLSKLDKTVEPVFAALGSNPGRGTMKIPVGYKGRFDTYMLCGGNDTEVTTLDEVVKLAKYPVTLVKLDLEGGELDALRGATHLLQEQSPVLFVEVRHLQKSNLESITNFLQPYGYIRGRRFNATPTFEFYKPEESF